MIYTAVCSDEAYALHAAIALRSAALQTKSADFHGFFVDCGLTPSTRERCEYTFARAGVSYTWITVDIDSVMSLPTSTWVSPAGNVRLLLPELLPNWVDRVLYLDSDVLVLSDIAPLWKSFDTGYAAAASPDTPRCPRVENSENVEAIMYHGLLKSDPYFNSGIMMINLTHWRKEKTGQQVLQLIASVGEQFTYRNQTPMNIVLHGNWQVLDPTWNVTSSNFFGAGVHVDALLEKANILHFTYENPGTPHCRHPAEGLFLDALRHSGYYSPLEYARWRADTLRKRVGHRAHKELQMIRGHIALRTRLKYAYNSLLGRNND